jgi:hypothetical protein
VVVVCCGDGEWQSGSQTVVVVWCGGGEGSLTCHGGMINNVNKW